MPTFMSDEEGGVAIAIANINKSPALVAANKKGPVPRINFAAAKPNEESNDDIENDAAADAEAKEIKGKFSERKRKRARHRKKQNVSAASNAAGKSAAMQAQNQLKTPTTSNKLLS